MSFIAVGVGIAAGVGTAYVGAQGKKSAIKAQQAGLLALEPLDIDELKELGASTDIEKYRKQFEQQRELDPTFAGLRDRGAQSILAALMEDANGASLGDKSLNQIADDLGAEGPVTKGLIDDLIDRAKADLDAGATLPPEFQAELVKAGLESAGSTGYSIDGRGAAGTDIRRLLGAEGLALKQTRENNARTNLSAAEMLRQKRLDALSGLIELDNNIRGAKVQRAAGATQMGSAAVPNIGISGNDAVKMSMANTDMENQRTLAISNLSAQKKLANSEMINGMIGSVSSGIVGGMGGGAGGGGGIGSWIGGLFNKQPAQSPYAYGPGY